MITRSNDNQPGGRDLVGHSSVQAWSAGPLFPAVISTVETYREFPSYREWQHPMFPARDHDAWESHRDDYYARPLTARLIKTEYELTYPGRAPDRFATQLGAEKMAEYLNARAKDARPRISPAEMAIWDAAYDEAYPR